MLIYLIINFSLLTLFSLLIYIFCVGGLKGRARCKQTEVQTDKQTNKQTDRRSQSPTPKIGEQTDYKLPGAGSANSGADSACGLSACGLDHSAYGLATSVSTQLWAWPSNLCIEPFQKLLYQI